MKSLLSTNKRKETGIFRFFILFSKVWKIGVIKRADKMGDSTNSWPASTSVVRRDKVKPFHE